MSEGKRIPRSTCEQRVEIVAEARRDGVRVTSKRRRIPTSTIYAWMKAVDPAKTLKQRVAELEQRVAQLSQLPSSGT